MFIMHQVPFRIDEADLAARLQVDSSSEDARELQDVLQRVYRTAAPRAVYREAFISEKGPDWISLEGVILQSTVLRRNLEQAQKVFPYVMTCGAELDRIRMEEDDLLHMYWLDTIKNEVLYAGVRSVEEEIRKRFSIPKSGTMRPGSGDAHVWPLEQQHRLFSLLGEGPSAIGVSLTESCLMLPEKTVSGLLFPTELDYRSCRVCRREDCPARSSPFDPDLAELLGHSRQ
jgi:hypothetical protein